MTLPDRHAWLFSVKTYLAAIAALYIAMYSHLSRPYWAMATVYIVSQPMLGPTRAKGFYRVLGTLIASAAILVALPNLVETPLLLSAAMSLWMATCLFFTLITRGPRGYMFMLAGYTTAFVGFPAVDAPETIFDTVVARSEEIVLGTVLAVLMASVVFPVSVKPLLRARLGNWIGDARQWCQQVLRRGASRASRNRLAAELAQFEALIEFVRLDDPRHAGAAGALERLRERMLLLMPVLSSIADRLAALRAGGHALPEPLPALVEDIAAWLEETDEASLARYRGLRQQVTRLKPAIDNDLGQLLLTGLLLRLEELLDLWHDFRTLRQAAEGGHAPQAPLYFPVRVQRRRHARHIDYGMVGFSALSAGLALLAYCVLWTSIGWEHGAFGAMMAAITSSFFAAQDDPAPGMHAYLLWSVLAALLAGICLFAIFPAIYDFGALALVLGALLIPLGSLLPSPKTAMVGLPLMVNLTALMSAQDLHEANFEVFANNAISIFIGIAFAVLMTRLFRSVGAEWTARRLVRQGWTTLAEAAEGHGSQDRSHFAARMLDLLGLLAPRLAATAPGSDLAAVDMLEEVRIGLNILQLRRARHDLADADRAMLDAILLELAQYYRRQAELRRRQPGPDSLRDHLDMALTATIGMRASKARDEVLMGLLGLRYGLFPAELPAVEPA